MTNNQQSTTNKGFTIIESLISITILVLAITGAVSAMRIGILSYTFSKDQVVAFYLAQEGFEQIRNIRDENGLKNIHWLTGISYLSSDPCYFGKACTVDPVASSLPIACSSPGNCPVLRQNQSTGFFGYDSSWTPTIFKRQIILTSINSNEISVVVTVDWSKGLITRQFRARENLLDWQ